MSSWNIIGWVIIIAVVGVVAGWLLVDAFRVVIFTIAWRKSLKIVPAHGQIWKQDGENLYLFKQPKGHFTVSDYDPSWPGSGTRCSWGESPEEFENRKRNRLLTFEGYWLKEDES